MDLHEKLFIVRKLLSLRQKDAAIESGVNQTVLSILERGERDAVPYDYFLFLYNKGIDINWFFNSTENMDSILRNKEKELIKNDDKKQQEFVSMNQHLWVSEVLALKNVRNLDKVLNELLYEIKHLNVKLED